MHDPTSVVDPVSKILIETALNKLNATMNPWPDVKQVECYHEFAEFCVYPWYHGIASIKKFANYN